MADFTITTPTLAIGAGSPSRAISLTTTVGSTGSTTSFALTDGSAGGSFYPSSPVTIPAGAVGSVTQFVYTPAAGASGTITIQAVATGGISATHTIALPIGAPSNFAKDLFTGSAGVDILGTSPTTGGAWGRTYLATYIDSVLATDGSGRVYKSAGGSGSAGLYFIPTAGPTEHDIVATITGYDTTHNSLGLITNSSGDASQLNGYTLTVGPSGYYSAYLVSNVSNGQLVAGTGSAPTGGATTSIRLSVRSINGNQVLFAFAGGTLLTGWPVVDNRVVNSYAGLYTEGPANSAGTGQMLSNFLGQNVDWVAPATSYTLTGLGALAVGQTSTYTISPNGAYTGTVSLTDGSAGGVFSPSSITWTSEAGPKTFTYTNSTPQTVTLSASASPSMGTNQTLSVLVRNALHFYISSAGNDSNNGTTTGTSWLTLTKVNASLFVPGDIISFKGGDTFSGKFTANITGSTAARITVNSYGTGQAVISSGTDFGIFLANNEFYTIDNIKCLGSGWTGSGVTITPVNQCAGIYNKCTKTSGTNLRNITISNCTVYGYYYGIILWNIANGAVGFTNAALYKNDCSNNLMVGSAILGLGAYTSGANVSQNRNCYIGYSTFKNIPGDPNSGTNGVNVDGAAVGVGEATGSCIYCCTGAVIEHNYLSGVGGFGGYFSGAGIGGSAGHVVANVRGFKINYNESTLMGCIDYFDGCAIDADDDCQDGEMAYNLSYNNIGPAIQWGGFNTNRTSNVRIHHNISYNDMRGKDARTSAGVFRTFGDSDNIKIYNNTIYLDKATAAFNSTPCCYSAENNTSTTNVVINNIFKVSNGSYIFQAPNGVVGDFTVSIASPGVFTLNSHGLTAGRIILLRSTGVLPTGLVAGQAYYVISAGLTTNTFRVSTTLGGAAVNTSGSQSGTHTAWDTASHLPGLSVLGNCYDFTGGPVLISNDTGSLGADIKSLAAWQAVGYETLNGISLGVVADSGQLNVLGFTIPTGGFIPNGISIASITAFDLASSSPCIGAGISPWLVANYIDLGTSNYHGGMATQGASVDIGACPYGVPFLGPTPSSAFVS